MIIVTFLAGISFLPRMLRTTFPPLAATASTNLSIPPSLKQVPAAPGRKLPLRGRIWGACLPPWPNYGRSRGDISVRNRRNRGQNL
jgi:hypothetical protein